MKYDIVILTQYIKYLNTILYFLFNQLTIIIRQYLQIPSKPDLPNPIPYQLIL